MKHLTIMLKPASSLCNLRCKYCFYADITSLREVSSFGVMKESAMTAVMDHIFIDLDDGDYLTLSFQGGEPMLAGLPFYRNLVQYIAGKKRNIHINYTLMQVYFDDFIFAAPLHDSPGSGRTVCCFLLHQSIL